MKTKKVLIKDGFWKKDLLWKLISLIFLLAFIVAGVKGNFFQKVLIRLNVIEKPMDPDYWAVRGWTNTLEQLGYDADIVFFGNSITYGAHFNKYFQDLEVVNLGYPGDNIKGMLERLPQIRCLKPEKVFVMAGINNRGTSDDKFRMQYAELIDSLLTVVPAECIYVESMLPVNYFRKDQDNDDIVRRNGYIKTIANNKGCRFIDLHSVYSRNGELPAELTIDGLHLRDEAYSLWAEAIRRYVYE